MNKVIKTGDYVAWKWGSGVAEGVVTDVNCRPTEIISKGKTIKRNGSSSNPAITIQHMRGNLVLKLASEVQLLK